jgi:hypothetical protein
MAEQLKGCLIVHAASIFTKKPLVNGLILPFGLENLLIGFLLKKSLAFWVKKSPLWSGHKKRYFI